MGSPALSDHQEQEAARAYDARPWLGHYPPEVPPSLSYPRRSLVDLFRETALRHPDRVAAWFYGSGLRYGPLLAQVRSFAGALAAMGVGPGDRVAIILPNLPQTVIAYYAVLWLGAVVVMTNPLYTPRELRHQLADAQVKVAVVLDLVYPRLAEVAAEVGLAHIVVTSAADYLPVPLRWLYPLRARREARRRGGSPPPSPPSVTPARGVTVHRFTETVRHAPAPDPWPVDPDNDLALLQYTGGTTGLSKGAMLTHANLVANCVQAEAWLYRMRERQQSGPVTVMAALPFFHVYGLTTVLNFCILQGMTMVLVPRFEVEQVLKLISRYRPALFPGVPTMYVALLHHPRVTRYRLDSIEACISGAAPLPLHVQEAFESLTGGRIIEGYGLTEASPVTHANPVWGERRPGSIGLPWPDTWARIVDPTTGAPVPVGEVGELLVKGPQVMKGYWRRPEETAAALRDGWLWTGDLARMDPDGYFYIVDRKKDIIIAGGFNIYPREVEEVLYEHPAVQEAAVVGTPDPYRGETVKAFVVLRPGQTVSAEELEAFCRQRLAAYKVPRLYEFRSELPKSLVGKVLRRLLREEQADSPSHGGVATPQAKPPGPAATGGVPPG